MTLTTTFQKIATGGTQVFGAARGYLELYAKYNSQDKVNNTTNYEVKCMLVVTGGYIGDYQSTTLTMSATGYTPLKHPTQKPFFSDKHLCIPSILKYPNVA